MSFVILSLILSGSFISYLLKYQSAGSGNRTRTGLTAQGILSPLRLPVPPPRQGSYRYSLFWKFIYHYCFSRVFLHPRNTMFASDLTPMDGTTIRINIPTCNTSTRMGRLKSPPPYTENGIMYFTPVFSHGLLSTFSIISLISLGLILPDSNISLSILYISLA